MTERLNHKLDVSKLKTLTDVKNVFECMCLISNASEGYEKYELIKEYFTIPNEPQELKLELPRKSLEEISQEFDEKIDKQIEDVEYKFAQLKYYQEYQFSKKITKIIEDIEYAKKHGQFPVTLTVGDLCCTNVGISSTVDWSTDFRIGTNEVGYWDIKPNIKVYLEKKPNRVVRYFTKLLLDFTWNDK